MDAGRDVTWLSPLPTGTACGRWQRRYLVITPTYRHGVWTLAETWYAAHRARLPGGAAGRSASQVKLSSSPNPNPNPNPDPKLNSNPNPDPNPDPDPDPNPDH